MEEPSGAEEALERSRRETRAAFENRALMYFYLYDELTGTLGAQRAAEVMKKAIHRRGLQVGAKYRPAAEAGDLDEVGRIFCEDSACAGELFRPGVEVRDEESVVLSMRACPLVDAWRRLRLSPDEIDTLCSIAAAVDEGTFEGAGLRLEFLDRIGKPGSERCLLELRLPG